MFEKFRLYATAEAAAPDIDASLPQEIGRQPRLS